MKLNCHFPTISSVVYLLILTLTLQENVKVESQAVTEIKMGVMLNSDLGRPYSVQRVGPAIQLAMDYVNTQLLNSSYRLVKVLRVFDNICDARNATGVAADLYYSEQIHVIVGPACAYALEDVGILAGYWNIPIVTGLGDGGLFRNKTVFPTLTRFSYCQCRLRSVYASIFAEFGWTSIGIIYDKGNQHTDILGQTLSDGLIRNDIYPFVKTFYSSNTWDYKELLTGMAVRTRVILLIVSGELLRNFMLAAYDIGYPQSGEFVFLNFEAFPFPGDFWGDNHWFRNDSRDGDARTAYESLIRVSLHVPRNEDWAAFASSCKELSKTQYGFVYGDEEVNFFVGAFHEGVIRYGEALNATIELGADLKDGYSISRRMWDYTTIGVTGDVIIDDNGDRDTNFAIKDMDPDTGEFEIVANYWGAIPGYHPVEGRSVHWPGGKTGPPPNEPYCGYQNEKPICKDEEVMPVYMVVTITVFAVVVMALCIGFVVYRRVMYERDLNSTSWLVDINDIKFRQQPAHKLSLHSVKTTDSHSSVHHYFTLVGTYKSEMVALKKVRVYKIDVNRKVLLELKQVRTMHHCNLARFLGACMDPGNSYILTEYCKKGSLQDVLLADSLKLDWPFKLSLLRDIAKGMVYIHHSDLGVHGNLTSSNCMVDGKFNVKITDFGLPSFRQVDIQERQTEEYRHEQVKKLLWVAPEHIRRDLVKQGMSKKGDVYSFGIIMEEMMTRALPYESLREFHEEEEIIQRVVAHENPPFRPETHGWESPEGFTPLVEKCWDDDPDHRPTFDCVLKDFIGFTGGKEEALVDRLLTRLEEYTSNLEEIVEERTKQLDMEKKKSEILLDEILPRSVSDKLKHGQPVDPESYDSVTIYFSDIKGFTALSAESTPLEVVALLNALYSKFDAAIDHFDVYKVETIGDAYMVCSGLPIRNGNNHVLHIARLSLELLDVVSEFVVPHRPEVRLQLRIGLHSGPAVAGVVGLKMPRYCLFGDTVNTASRMETTGAAQKIHISDVTKNLLDQVGNFETELRGDVEMKGKGVQTTYWLKREIKDNKSNNFNVPDTKSELIKQKSTEYYLNELDAKNTSETEILNDINTALKTLRNSNGFLRGDSPGKNLQNWVQSDGNMGSARNVQEQRKNFAKNGSLVSTASMRDPQNEPEATSVTSVKSIIRNQRQDAWVKDVKGDGNSAVWRTLTDNDGGVDAIADRVGRQASISSHKTLRRNPISLSENQSKSIESVTSKDFVKGRIPNGTSSSSGFSSQNDSPLNEIAPNPQKLINTAMEQDRVSFVSVEFKPADDVIAY